MPASPRPRRPWYRLDLLAALDRLRALLAAWGAAELPWGDPRRLRAYPELVGLEPRMMPDGRPLPLPVIYTGAGGGAPLVRAYDAEDGDLLFTRTVFESSFAGGVRVAAADLTRDGYPDVVAAAGPGAGPRVRVLDGKTGEQVPGPIGSFWAFESTFAGGVHVAAADVDGDGYPDVVAAAGVGGGPRVRVVSGRDGSTLADFFAYDPAFRGGITVAAADLTGDRRAEIAVGAGPGGGPRVRVYDGATLAPLGGPLGSFFAFAPDAGGGVFTGADALAGDYDADGTLDLVVGTGPGVAGRVKVFSGATGAVLRDFEPFGSGMTGGVRVAVAYADDDEFADVVVGTGPGGPATVRVFSGATGEQLPGAAGEYAPFGASTAGVYVAASNDPPMILVEVLADAAEPGTAGTFRFSRAGTTGDELVTYSVSGSATSGTDYTALPGSVTIPSGSTYVDVTLSPLDDALAEGAETVEVTPFQIAFPNDPGPWSATMLIADDDSGSSPPPPPGTATAAVTGFSDDTGASAADRLTNDTTLTVFGTATAGSTVTLLDRLTTDAAPAALGTTTASGAGLWTLTYATALPEGAHELTATAAVGGDPPSPPSAPFPLVVDTTPPVVRLTTPAHTTEVAPPLRVTVFDLWGLPPGPATLDVDLNNDFDFADAGETGYATTSLAAGAGEFTGYAALAVSSTVRLRVRVTDLAGNDGESDTAYSTIDASPTGEATTDLTPAVVSVAESPDGTGTAWEVFGLGVGVSVCGCQDGQFVYSSDAAAPKVVVHAAVQSDNAKGVPDQVVGTLTWDGAVVGTVTYGTAGLVPGADWEFAALSPADPAEGRHTYALDLFLDYPGTSADVSRAVTGSTFTAGGDDGPFGAGWRLSNTDRLVTIPAVGGNPAGVLRVEGHGGWRFYEWTGSGYATPAGDAGALAALGGGGFEYTAVNGTVRAFNAAGRMTGWASGDGAEAFAYAYDGSGRLATMTTPDGGVTTVAYDGSDHATTLALPGGRVVTLTYAGTDLTRIDDPAGGAHTFAYDADHRLLSATRAGVTAGYTYQDGMLATVDPGAGTPAGVAPALGRALADGASGPGWGGVTDGAGAVTRRRFDALGREVERVAADGGVTRTARDGNGHLTAVTDPLGRTTTFTVDGTGDVTRAEAPDGGVRTYTYDPTTHVQLTATDEFGKTTSYAYDGYQVRTVTDPLGGVTTLTWDDGLVAAVTNPLGETATATYDAQRRLTGWTVGGVSSGTLLYDAAGFVAGQVDALGHTATVVNDARGRPVAAVAPTGERGTVAYDAAGRVLWATDPGGVTTSYGYDGAGRVEVTVEGYGTGLERRTTAVYDASGRQVAAVDPLGQRTTWGYDGAGRVVAVTDPLGNVSRTVFDLAGGVVASIDPLGRVTRYGYDAAGRPATTTDPLGHVTTAVYDAAGRVVAAVDPLGHRTTAVYDDLARVVAAIDPLGNRSTSVYDAAGRVSAAVDPLENRTTLLYDARSRPEVTLDALGGRATTVYDAAGRVSATVDPLGRRTTWVYDDAGRLVATVDPLGSRSTTVYEAGRAVAAVDPLGNRTTAVYDALGRREATVDALGQRATWVYDAAGRVVALIDQLGQQATWVYDAAGRAVASVDPLGNRATTTYDAAGQVVATTDPLGRVTRHGYDGDGRRVTTTDALGGVTTAAYDDAGRAVAWTDPLGRRTTTVYDDAGRAIAVVDALGHRSTAAYDAAGNLVERVDPRENTTTTAYDALNRAVVSIDALGGRSTTVYDAAGQVEASVNPLGQRTSWAYDAAGRAVAVIDPLGNRATTAYDAAGNAVESADPRGSLTTAVYDALNRVSAAVDALGGRTTTTYDAAGHVSAVTDPLGRATTFLYDAAGRRTTTLNPLEQPRAVAYDAAGNVVATIDPLGNRTTTVYDALNRAVATVDALGNRATAVYDAAGHRVAVVDALGRRTTTGYDALGRAVSATDALGGVTTAAYDAAGNVIEVTDPLGHTSTTVYDALNRPVAVVDALGYRTTTAYDAASRTTAWVDQLGRTTTTGYDAAGRVVLRVNPLGEVSTVAYDAAGNVVGSTDPLGNTTTTAYDSLNRAVTTTDPLGNVTTAVYDAAGQVTGSVDPLGQRSTWAYDAAGRGVATTDPLGNVTTAVYDAAGNAVELTDPLGNRTTTVYDALNRAVATVDPLGNRATTVYDAADQPVAVVDALGRRTTTGYDTLGRAFTTTDPLGGITTAAYDAAGRRTALTDPVANTTTWAYDALGRVATETDPLAGSRTYAYDPVGRLASRTDRLGRRVDFGYDTAGRTTSEAWFAPGGAPTQVQTWTYDDAGRVLTAADPDGTYTFTYDDGGRVAHVAEPFGLSLTFGYDAAGNRTRVEDSRGGVTTVTFDAAGRQTGEELTVTGVARLRELRAYDPDGRLATVTRQAWVSGAWGAVGTTTHAYDAEGAAAGTTHAGPTGTALVTFAYARDAADQVTSQATGGAERTYTYDATGQLTDDTGTGYAYDASGNRTGGGYTTGAGNRTSADGVWTYTYDAEGNLAKRSKGAAADTWVYGYDHRNHLTTAAFSATDGGAVTQRVTYAYDALENRIERRAWDGSVATVERYGLDGWDPAKPAAVRHEGYDAWVDLDGAGSLTARRVYGPGFDEVVARVDGAGNVSWYGTDQLGSVRAVFDNTGGVVATAAYDAFGNLVSGAPADRYAYAGREWDAALGAYYVRARVYDPAAGRWWGEDGSGFAAGDANLSRYVGNRPTAYRDPSGMAWGDEWTDKNVWGPLGRLVAGSPPARPTPPPAKPLPPVKGEPAPSPGPFPTRPDNTLKHDSPPPALPAPPQPVVPPPAQGKGIAGPLGPSPAAPGLALLDPAAGMPHGDKESFVQAAPGAGGGPPPKPPGNGTPSTLDRIAGAITDALDGSALQGFAYGFAQVYLDSLPAPMGGTALERIPEPRTRPAQIGEVAGNLAATVMGLYQTMLGIELMFAGAAVGGGAGALLGLPSGPGAIATSVAGGVICAAPGAAITVHGAGVALKGELTAFGNLTELLDNIFAVTPTNPGGGGGTRNGAYRGGRHRDTSKPAGDGLESHHTPSNAANEAAGRGVTRADGPAIQMDPADHARTASNGKMPGHMQHIAAQTELIKKGRMGEAIQMDIDDIRLKFGTKYDDAILEMLNSLEPWMKIGLKSPPF